MKLLIVQRSWLRESSGFVRSSEARSGYDLGRVVKFWFDLVRKWLLGYIRQGGEGRIVMYRGFLLILLAVHCVAGCGGGGTQSITPTTPTAASPGFTPAPGAYPTTQSVTLTDTTAGASIYYTTNGTTPSSASTLFSATTPITVSSTTTIQAIAIASGYLNSAVGSATYTINLPAAATPTFSPAPGIFTVAQSVSLSDTTTGAVIHYTVDGSTPSANSTVFTPGTPIAVNSTTTINAIGVAAGYSNSAVATGTYTINLPAAATPTFSPAPGSYTNEQSVSLADTTPGAQIHYTVDGSTPSVNSTLFTAGTPIAVATTTVINAIAVAAGYSNSAVATGTYTFPGSASAVSVVLTTNDETNLMAAQPSVNFSTSTTDAGTNTVVVDSTQQYQSMEGFGAAFTDSAAYLLMKTEPSANLPATLNDLFTRNNSGIGLSFMRIPMGGSDIALSVYSYDDQPVGTTDLTLANFSISHDQAYILPLIVQAKALNPQMKLMANPWSPPGWMKDPASMNPVSMLGGNLLLTSANETAFANYFVKFLQAYQTAGAPIDYISLQNEPENVTTAYPSMLMPDTTQLALLQGYVLPALSTANLSTKVFVWDHNWDTPSYPQYVLSGLTPQQLTQVAGTAWHGYAGAPGAQQIVQNEFPTLGTWETEHSGGTWQSDQFTADMLEITLVLRNAAKSFVKWSLALNENLGPDLTQNAGLGGCNTCTPIVTVNSSTGAVTKDIEYYTLGHYSKYVLPGAVRVYSSNTPTIASVAFENPDGSMALIAYNSSTSSQTFQVQWGTQSFSYTLPATSAATFSWTGTPTGSVPPILATAQIQASSYSSESGLETESTGDSTGEYDLGYVSVGASAVYKNVDFGSSAPTSVSVREASGGGGGTATFYLDSPTGTPISSVTLPVTGGWQSWQTVTGSVSGVTGVHDLYIVFTGSASGIANLNWFQFQ
ncbi:MAG: chitobiase/beta-hexosaminidase C-terminal domain-containing protein [Terracidiphilus sp.]